MSLNVIVVGAGIGGPTVAAALAKKGHKVTIYERENSTTEVGFAFRITANSDRCLKHLGVDPEAGGACAAHSSRTLDQDGNITRELRENADPNRPKTGVSVFASRPHLAKQIVDNALASGVEIKGGVKVTSVDVEKTEITLEDGTHASADLIVAADGIHSVVRSFVVDTNVYQPHPTLHRNCFRFSLPTTTIESDPELSKFFTGEFQFNAWFNKTGDKGLVMYPVNFEKEYSITCIHPAHLSESVLKEDGKGVSSADVSYNKPVPLDKVKEIFAEFEPRVHRLFNIADPNGFRIWKLRDLQELPRWSVNRTLLIGDAAHAVLPFGFSGAGTTIEDAVMLGEFLPGDIPVEDIIPRLKLLEKVRKPRVGYVREYSSREDLGDQKKDSFGDYMKTICDYDTVEVAKEALKESGLTA